MKGIKVGLRFAFFSLILSGILIATSALQIIPLALGQETSNATRTLGSPFYTENGQITSPYTYNANGTLANIGNVTNNGFILTTPISNGLVYGEGQGILKTEDLETATYIFQFIGSLNPGGQDPHGSWYIFSNATGKLAFLNDIVGITEAEVFENGQFSTKVWHWK